MSAQKPLRLSAAMSKIRKMRPYVTAAMLALIPVETREVDTMAVDEYGRLYFNPEWIDKVSVEELAGVVYHEIWHLLRKHHDRLSQYPQAVANLAADLEINDDIRSESIPLPEGVFYPEQFGFPPNQTAEYYAGRFLDEYEIEYVPQNRSSSGSDGGGSDQSGQSTDTGQSSGQSGRKRITVHVRGFGGLEGSGATGQSAPWEVPKGDGSVPHLTNAEWEIIREQVAQDVRRFRDSSMRGEVPEHWKRWADDVLTPPEIPWQALLRSLVNSAVTTAAGRVDYTYRRVSRRQYAVDDVVLPGLGEPVVRSAVVLDVSGSVGDESLGVALREVRGILDSSHGRLSTRVYAVDSQVQAAADVFDVSEIKRILKGGGGTDMGVGIAAAMESKPDVIIVITDGLTPWPANPGVPVIVCLFEDRDVPSWARKVVIKRGTP
jgi:predicted metal-dependent peptidase